MNFRIIFLALLFLASCTPKYNAQAVEKTKMTWDATNALFDKIIQSPDKNYTSYEADYGSIDTEIAALQELDRTRTKNKSVVKILTDIQNRFDTYENEHKTAGNINNSEASAYKNGMDVLWKMLYRTETNLTQ